MHHKNKKYSDSVAKDGFVSQSIADDKEIYEDDKITIIISLGKEPTFGQKNALKSRIIFIYNAYVKKRNIQTTNIRIW